MDHRKNRDVKVFVVDDDKFYLNIMKQLLKDICITDVTTMENGEECMARINEKPDLVFLDHHLETYSGYEILRSIMRRNPNILVVMVSGQKEISLAVEAIKCGAFDYIEKGVNMVDRVHAILKRMHALKQAIRPRRKTLIAHLRTLL